MKQTKSRRILALLLSLVMLVSLLPLQAFSEAELTDQTETSMEQTMETDVSDETTESDDPAADDEQTDENPVEEGDGDYEELHEESAPTDLDESESEEPDEPVQETVDETEYQEEQDTEPVTEPDVMPDPADEPELIPQPSEETDIPPDEVQDEIPDEEADDEPLIEPDDPLPQEPAGENVDQETLSEMEPTEELTVVEEADEQMTVADCISAYGHVYATTLDAAMVFADSAMLDEQHIFIISQAGALLLATAYVPETDAVKVWFMASDGEILTGYVHADVLAEIPVTDEQADEMANILWFDYADSEAGTLLVFVVAGEKLVMQEEQPAEESAVDELPIEGTTEKAEVPETEAHAAAIGDFLYVTTQTRVFMEVDDTAADDYYGDYFLGYFLRDAAVQVEDVLEDSFGRVWYGISYVFGPDEGDGLICELIGHVYVLADETAQTDLTWRTATDYGYPPDYMRPMLLANYYYDLEDHYGGVASFYVGESGLHATTGHDNEYLPIARHDEYGTIFATPHYMKGETAYCLEHTQNSPVVRDHDSGPYTVVDLAGYKVTPGHSGYIFSEKTMHALAWVLRHTYPFMVLDRSDADNDVWCRVAGQFAMREVIKELEGDFYVMDYWEMDEFYRAYDHAPGVYLDYARWLAAEALDYIENFGNITVADKSVRASGGQYIGTATLYTSADQMRISKSVGTVTGNSGGDDWEYYYLYSGDTVSITSSRSKFSVPIEIIPSADDEALYYVAVTDADIQKLILPVYGDPYPYQAAVLDFEVPHGAASVTKKDAVSGGNLSGATFELLSGSTVIQTLTTGSGGTATFSNLTPGTYTIREKTAPQGYLNSSPNTQTVTVTAGNTASVTFTNNRKTSKIRIQKTDQLTGQALAGAEFTITRLSAPAGSSGVGSVAAVITTDANGVAETGWLEWGRFRITETKVPEDYQDSGYSVEIEAYENGKTYVIDVQNQPIPGYIQLTKTDANRGTPLSGVQFDIYYNDAYGSGLVGTMTTDADGVARSGALRKGTYQVKEHANPEGYTGELVTLDAIVRPDETTYLSADNQPIQGKIRIQKSDQLTSEALAGAEFTITRLSSSSAAGGAGVGETVVLTTDENGVAETGWLDYGTYEVRETKVPVHFVDNSFSQQIALFEHEKTYTLDVENEPTKGYIKIVKTDALDQTPIEGVQFDIYYNAEYGEGLAATMTTNADGVAVSEPLRKGRYIVREHANPTGYVSELVELHTEVKSDETTYLSADNQPIQGQIRIIKKDELTKEALAGAEFTITRISGLPSHKGAGDGDVVAVMTTDASGVALSPLLTWGTYLLEETVVPVHFVDNDYSAEVTIDAENMQTYEVAVENEPTKGYIQIVKTDALDQTPIEGVQFDIFYNDEYGEELAATMTTNADGVAVSEPLRKGKYIVREHANPAGYVSELVEFDSQVKSDETTYLSADNQPIEGQIRIVKKDELTGEALAGAEFTITRISGLPSHKGKGDGDVVAVMTTDASGVALSPLLTWGTYLLEETVVPVHFVDNDYSAEVTIDAENMQTYEVGVENEPTKGYIQIVKTDALDQTPIEGVQFDIFYNDEYGEGLAATMTTNADGVAVSEPIRKGKYIVREHANPTGYVSELVELHAEVKSDETTYLSADNQPIQAQIRIIKKDELTKEALAGAEFTITRISGLPSHKGAGDGDVVAVMTTDASGVALSPLLTWGTYRVEETVVPVHFVDNNYSIEVTIDAENLQTIEVEVENEPTKGFIQLTKSDRLNGNPIEGVHFDLYYNDQYGEGLATSMVTDANGVALSEPIRKGRYIVKENGATVGYFFEEVTLDATVKSDETTELEATNQPVMARLRIYKRDADEYGGDIQNLSTRGDGKLTGAEFQVLAAEDILDRQGNIVHAKGDIVVPSIFTEGEDAAALTDDLWPGRYEIVEVTPPAGYAASDEHFFVDASSAADQSEEAVIVYDGLKPNEILYGAKAIVKLLGDDNTDPDPERVETPEEGAEFEVYLASAGSYEDARELERDYLITDENGYAMTKALPYGMYVLRQTVAKDGYEIKGPILFEIKGTESLTNPPILTLTNMPILYRLRFIKTDAETGRIITLANTSFKLKDADGEYVKQMVYYPREEEIDTFTTDETGCVTLPETVTWGLYFIEEVESPEGYLIRSEDFAVFVGREGDTPDTVYELDIEIPNDPVKGQLRLEKKGLQLTGFEPMTDAYGNEYQKPIFELRYLAGAVFEVRAAEDIVGRDGTVWFEKDTLVDTITTTEAGGDMSKVLPLGKYIVTEVETPAGYVCDPKEYEAELVFADNQTAMVETVVEIENAYLTAEITLLKEKEILQTQQEGEEVRQIVTTTPGEGFVFGLFTDQDIRYSSGTLMADTLVVTGTTDEHGSLTFSGLFPHGAYYVRELSAPDGWKLSAERYPVTLDPAMKAEDAHVIRVALDEPIHNELIYSKITLTKTDITGEETLPGAQIEVRNEDGEVIYRAYTDENGEIPDIPVTPGRYTFREIYAPEGYALNETEMQFEVDADGNITGDTTIRDDFTRVQLVKLDEEDQPLEGVQFTLSDMNGDILKIEVSDENGLVTFDRIPYGTFVIEESRPLNGYILTDKKVMVIVNGEFVNPLEPLDTFKNYPNQAVIRKVDQNGKPLEGAVFGLFDEYGIREMSAVSDENGMVRFEKIPHGDYTIREIEAPIGYLLSKEVVNLTVDDSYVGSDTPIATLTNHFKRLRYKKVDTSGKALADVEFSLINAKTNEIVETVVSDERGEFIFTEFDYGDWIIRETKVPDGYMQMEDISLHVDEGWTEPEPFTCVNVPNTYDFLKVDNRRNPIPGVLFALEDSEGNVIGEFESGEDGVVHVTGLVPGSYVIREIRPADGFTRTDEVIELEIDEKYEPPKRMKRLKNYPTIQTGVDLMVTPVMMAGGGLMLIGVVLGAIYGMKKLVRKRRK